MEVNLVSRVKIKKAKGYIPLKYKGKEGTATTIKYGDSIFDYRWEIDLENKKYCMYEIGLRKERMYLVLKENEKTLSVVARIRGIYKSLLTLSNDVKSKMGYEFMNNISKKENFVFDNKIKKYRSNKIIWTTISIIVVTIIMFLMFM